MQNTQKMLRSFLQIPDQVNITLEVRSTDGSLNISSLSLNTSGDELDNELPIFKLKCLGFEFKKKVSNNKRVYAVFATIGDSISIQLLHYLANAFSKKTMAERTQEVRELILRLSRSSEVVDFPSLSGASCALQSGTNGDVHCNIMELPIKR